MEFKEKYQFFHDRFEKVLDEYLLSIKEDTVSSLYESITYSVKNGGKRIRPVLMYAVADMLKLKLKKVDKFAIALELIHTYSLIHDDLPAMDNDDYRRGKLSSHKQFGEAMAILTGDGLLNLAIECCFSSNKISKNEFFAIKTLFKCAGVFGMIKGQVLDLEGEKKEEYSAGDYIDISSNKTAKLINASMIIPSILKKYKL